MFPLEIDRGVPPSSMKTSAIEVLQARDVWPTPRIQHTRSIDKDVAGIADSGAIGEISDLNIPLAPLVVPHGLRYLVSELDIFSKFIFLAKRREIFSYLLRSSVNRGPVGIGFKAESVNVGWNVAGAPRAELQVQNLRIACRKKETYPG